LEAIMTKRHPLGRRQWFRCFRLFDVLGVLLGVPFLGAPAAAQILEPDFYVHPDGDDGNAGSSWELAFATIDRALEAADPGDVIFVAAGTYSPDPNDPKDPTRDWYKITEDILLIGGMDGTEAVYNDRDVCETNSDVCAIFSGNATVLSGDLIGDDDLDDPTVRRSDNTKRVIELEQLTTASRVDGFVITGGSADYDSSGINNIGGGMHIDASSSAVVRCWFQSNLAGLTNAYGEGGAISVRRKDGPTGNTPRIVSCVFRNNLAYGPGGAVFLTGNIDSQLEVDFIDCLFHDNVAKSNNVGDRGRGGGLACTVSAEANIDSCTFADNEAIWNGTAPRGIGGGVYVGGGTSCVAVGRNSIFWGNVHDDTSITDVERQQVYVETAGFGNSFSALYSDIEGLATYAGTGNVAIDPSFLDATSSDYRIGNCLAIDIGDDGELAADLADLDNDGSTSDVLPFDVADWTRIQNGVPEFGAYEHCVGDVDFDGLVGFDDLLALNSNWGPCAGTCAQCPWDINRDGTVGFADQLAVLSSWGKCSLVSWSASMEMFPGGGGDCLGDEHWRSLIEALSDPDLPRSASDNWLCWTEHYVRDCSPECEGGPACPSADPYGDPCDRH
jgi:hypothetical protein